MNVSSKELRAPREAVAAVRQKRSVRASPERVWSLLTGPAAWSLVPDRFAFDAVSGAGTRRFRVVLALWTPGLVASDVYEVSEDPVRRVLTLRLASSTRRRDLSACSLTFAVKTGKRGAEVVMSAEFRGRRHAVSLVGATWRETFGRWLKECAAVLEDRRALPVYGLPPAMHEACMDRREVSEAGEVFRFGGSALIGAPPEDVWPLVYEPEQALADEPGTIAAGYVPGTPVRRAGEVQYHVHGHPGEVLRVSLVVVDDYEENWSALTHATLASGFSCETRYLAEPDGTGTRVTINTRVLHDRAAVIREQAAGFRVQMEDALAENFARWKTVIENRRRS